MIFILSKRKLNLNYGKQRNHKVSHNKVSHKLTICLKYLQQDQNLSIRSLSRRILQFSTPVVWRHAIKKFIQSKQKGSVDVRPK